MNYKVKTILTTYSFSVYLELESNSISLSYDGENKYQSTDVLECDSDLDIFLRVNGLNGTSWKLEIEITKLDDPSYKKEYEKSGSITDNQTSRFEDKVEL